MLYGHGPSCARSAWPVLVRPMALQRHGVGWPACALVWRCEPPTHHLTPGWRHLHGHPICLGALSLNPAPSRTAIKGNRTAQSPSWLPGRWPPNHTSFSGGIRKHGPVPSWEPLQNGFLTRLITANCATLLSRQPCPEQG